MNPLKTCFLITLVTFSLVMCKTETKTEKHPFDATFTGVYTSVDQDVSACGEYPWVRVINDGNGTDAILGKFTHHFDFCADMDSGFYPGKQMAAYLIDENNDTLFISSAGRVMGGRMDDHPEHVISFWRDPFKIMGGTGRYAGASGSGMTDDYNSSLDTNSHHHWVGTIVLAAEKKN